MLQTVVINFPRIRRVAPHCLTLHYVHWQHWAPVAEFAVCDCIVVAAAAATVLFLVVKPHCYAQHKNAACCYWCSVISVCVCGTQLWGLQNGWSCHLGSALGVTRTHAHTALCPGLPGSAGARNVKPIWILLKQQTVSGSGLSWAKCKSASHSRQITTPAPHHSVFTGRMPFLPPNQQHQSTEGSWTQHDYTKMFCWWQWGCQIIWPIVTIIVELT